MPAALTWFALVVAAAWFLVSAKVHGRQIRLERELHGYASVSFGPQARNPAWVEALWRADRWQFWTRAAASAFTLAGLTLLADRTGGPRPYPELPVGVAAAITGVAWALAAAFLLNGASSQARFRKARRRPDLPGPGGDREEWLARTRRATAGYWAAAVILGGVCVALAFV